MEFVQHLQTGTAQVVEAVDGLRLTAEGRWSGHILYAVAFPEAIGCPESRDAGLCGESGTGKDDEARREFPYHDR